MSPSPDEVTAATRPSDFVGVDKLLTDEERAIRDRVRRFVDDEVIPILPIYWDEANFPFDLLGKMGELGVMGGALQGYGCAGWSNVAYGLAVQEIARGSGSVSTFLHVQSGLAMTAIHSLGSEEQKQQWLPGMARCEKIGCFGLTEPDFGSDAGGLQTTATRQGDEYVLNGRKKWIGNGSVADVAVIWARTEDGKVGGFLVERGTSGYRADVMPRKGAQRAVWQTQITLEDCRVPAENRLPGAKGIGSTLSILTHSRYGVAWDGLGQALDCYETALAYAKQRRQFGRPIASYQLVQEKLVHMVTEISLAQVASVHVGRLKDAGEADPAVIAMLKMNNVGKARQIAPLAREILGGNGILLDYRVMEHMADIEGVYTYEGTHDVNLLVVGQRITGIKAFSAGPAEAEPRVETRVGAPG